MEKDLRAFLGRLEKRDDLARVKTPINDPHEIYSILWRLNDINGPAVVFENYQGNSIPAVANVVGTMDRFALACGFEPGKTDSELMHLFLKRFEDKSQWAQPVLVHEAPCQEVVIEGDDVNLFDLPIMKLHPDDGGPYITLPHVIMKDPKFGYNCGLYRMMVHDKNTANVMCNMFQDSGIYLQRAKEAGKKSLECAVVIGVDPSITVATATKMAPHLNELEFAAALRGAPVPMVKCKTIDLEVPANAEIILEGEIPVDEVRMEGPFGEWMGYHEESMLLNIFKVKCITHRRSPLYQMTYVAHAESEDQIMRLITQAASFTKSVKERVSGAVDAWLPRPGRGFMAVISIKKRYPGWGRQAFYQALSLPYIATSCNVVVIVDSEIDPSNMDQVIWAMSTRVDPSQDVIVVPSVAGYPLNPAGSSRPLKNQATGTTDIAYCGTLGIDATIKDMEERGRPASKPSYPVKEMFDQVVNNWETYGFSK